ncbi:MAG: O-antigen ligase family protein, partial [Thermoleophilaceae bacterium]
ALGAIAWFAIAPLRLRSLPVLLLPSAGAGLVAAWALSKDAFAETAQPLAVKESVAGEFGLLLLLMAAVLVVAGLAVNLGHTRLAPTARARRRLGIAALVVACAVPLVAFTSVAFSDRGLGGTIDDRVDELTSETDTAPTEQGAGRFSAASSTRGKYWREAGRVFADRRSVGTGAGTFAAARLRHRTDATVTKHAHGFVPQTLADLGIVGVALTAALLLAWLVAAARATALHPRRLPFRLGDREPPPRRDWNADRTAVVALGLIAVVFGLQSAIDWTWFVPGPAAMALVAAGFVAGRGPAAALPEGHAAIDLREPLRNPSPPRLLAASAVLLAALLSAWAIWQPESADRDTSDALALADAGDVDGALEKTRDAADTNPLSAEPLLVEAAIATRAGRETEARAALEQAVLEFPGDAETWYRLAAFQLGTLDRPGAAAQTIRGALYLDPHSPTARQLFLEARASEREQLAESSGR